MRLDEYFEEISRFARLGSISQQFFERCEDAGSIVAITDGWISEVHPDSTGKLIADISAPSPKRNAAGPSSASKPALPAQEQGKWIGRVPTGFHHDDDGYLQVLLDPDQEDGGVGYLEVRRALERVSDGESCQAIARDLPNLSRQGLSKIDNDPARQQWYLGAEAADERVDAALETVR